MLNLVLFTTGIDRTKEVVDRLTAFLQSTRTLSVEIKIKPFGETKWGQGRLAFERPNRTRFDLKTPGVDYSFTGTGEGAFEIDRISLVYDEGLPKLTLGYPASALTTANEFAFPVVLIQQDPLGALPTGATFSWKGEEVVDGQTVDHIASSSNGPGGNREAHIFVDRTGRPVRFDWRIVRGATTITSQSIFKNYRINMALPNSTFIINLPAGYVPRSLPPHILSPEPGEKLDLRGWTGRGGSAGLSAAIKGKTFLFVTAKDCGPSNELRPRLKEIAAGLKTPVIELAMGKGSKPRTFPTYEASSEAAWNRMGVDGTPMIFVIDKNAKMSRAWYGYDRSQGDQLRKYLKVALDELR